jgi:putative transposase
MRRSRFTPEQITAILAQVEAGKTIAETIREHGIAEKTYYNWKAKFGGMQSTEARRLRELEEENRRLKSIVANQAVDITVLKDLLGKKW